jgi:tetratricopeptide (TPR) repeat protein
LEGLALKQGAEEETLKISNPKDRSDVTPKWISEMAGQEPDPEQEPLESLEPEQSLEPLESYEPLQSLETLKPDEPLQPEPDRSLEDTQPVRLKPQEIPEPLAAQPAQTEEVLPDWLAGLDEEPPVEPPAAVSEAPVMPQEEISVEIPPAESFQTAETEEITTAETPAPTAADFDLNDMDAAMAWLESLAMKQGAEADSLKITAPESRTETPPAWISALAEQDLPAEPIKAEAAKAEATETEELEAEAPAAELTTAEVPVVAAAITPEPPAESPMPVSVESQPVAEVSPAAETRPAEELDIPSWLLNYEEEQQLKSQAWQAPEETPGKPVAQPPAADESVTVWLRRHHPERGTGPLVLDPNLEAPPPAGKFADVESALERKEMGEAVDLYSALVKDGENIDETIEHLRRSLDRHAEDAGLWQVLGDAYFKVDKVQEALEAYTQAEALIQ